MMEKNNHYKPTTADLDELVAVATADLESQLAARDRTIAELKAKIEDQEWLETSRENLLKISKRQKVTIAEQAEALEGLTELAVVQARYIDADREAGRITEEMAHWRRHEIRRLLTDDQIAALRQRGVEVWEVDGGNKR